MQYASKRLGTTPDKLQRTMQQGSVKNMASGLPKEDAARIQEVLSDRKMAEALLNSPQAQQLLQQLFNNKNKEAVGPKRTAAERRRPWTLKWIRIWHKS